MIIVPVLIYYTQDCIFHMHINIIFKQATLIHESNMFKIDFMLFSESDQISWHSSQTYLTF